MVILKILYKVLKLLMVMPVLVLIYTEMVVVAQHGVEKAIVGGNLMT
jgi:hypothetical protein